MKTLTLDKPSTYFRTTVARGISTKEKMPIDRAGGKYSAGIIRGFSVIATGEALGHDLWIDGVFLSQVADAINAADDGVKARFTHPGLSGDGLGKSLGRVFNARMEDGKVFADVHFQKAAHNAPDGDLAGYVLELAEEDAAAFGASISFRHDFDAQDEFMEQNKDAEGRFVSPDPENAHNFEHARLKRLRATDFVDSPAANPSGLFHSDPFELLEGGEAVLDYVFGLKTEAPDVDLGVDASRLKGFAARWASNRKLSFRKETEMTVAALAPAAPTETVKTATADLSAGTAPPPAAAAPSAPPPNPTAQETAAALAATPAPAIPVGQPVDNAKALADAKTAGRDEAKAELAKFTTLFGAEKGAKWFGEGKSIDECKDLHIADLTAANKEKDGKLAAATSGLGEDEALSGVAGGKAELPSKYMLNCGRNLGQAAQSIDAQAAKLGFTKPSVN